MPVSYDSFGLSFVPGDVLRVMKKIHNAGFEVWVVGGALRDLMLEIKPKDWDLATSANTGKIISLFPRVIPVGVRHGTVQVHTRTRDIEVTSFDPPGEAGILRDLGRRDFTINSLALSYPRGLLIDPHGGRRDLKAGIIRAVGNPVARFSEDPLRIIRAARICGAYSFSVDRPTFDAMLEGSRNLEAVSGERVRDELLKILMGADPAGAFDLLRRSGALDVLLPDLVAGAGVFEHTLACILNCPKRTRVRLAALFHKTAAPTADPGVYRQQADFRSESARIVIETMKAWNMSNRLIDEVSSLVRHQLTPEVLSWGDAEIRRFITAVRPELIEDFIALAEAEQLCGGYGEAGVEQMRRLRARMKTQLGRISAMSVRELALGGDEIMEMLQIAPGPQIGRVLKHLFDLVQEHPDLNTPERLAGIVKEFRKHEEP